MERLAHIRSSVGSLEPISKVLGVLVAAWLVASGCAEAAGTALSWPGACFAFILSTAGVVLAVEQGALQHDSRTSSSARR